MKKCPLCAEEIQDAAIRCRHCLGDLERRTAAWPVTAALGVLALVLLVAAAPSRRIDRPWRGAELVTTADGQGCPALPWMSRLPPGHPPVSPPLPGNPALRGLPPGHPPVQGLDRMPAGKAPEIVIPAPPAAVPALPGTVDL